MGHAFTVRLIDNSSEMKILCSEEGLRKLAGNLVGAQFLRVTPLGGGSSTQAASAEYEIFAQPGSASAASETETSAQVSTIAQPEVSTIAQPEPESMTPTVDRFEDDGRRLGPGALDWAVGYERHKAAERKRRITRYAICFGLLCLLPLSALVVLV